MQDALNRYERFLKRRYPQSTTPKHYLNDVEIFVHQTEAASPDAVTPIHIDDFIEAQIAANLAPTTINRRLSSLHSFFEFMAQENSHYDWPNPVIWKRHRMKRGSRLPRDASDRDISALFSVIDDPRDHAMFGLMIGAGLRVGEVAGLMLEDVYAPESSQLAKLRVRGKGDKERIVWLTPKLWRTLQNWIKQRPEVSTTVVFVNHHHRQISVSGIQYRFKEYCQKAKVNLNCHQLRHTFARRLVEGGMPLYSLSQLLGHAHLQTTQLYIDGANPKVQADFELAMAKKNASPLEHYQPLPQAVIKPATSPRRPSPESLDRLRITLREFPDWMAEGMDAYLSWHWPTWRAQTATHLGQNLISVMRQVWNWLD